jgi:hypothetical protein
LDQPQQVLLLGATSVAVAVAVVEMVLKTPRVETVDLVVVEEEELVLVVPVEILVMDIHSHLAVH